jgi:hypothetical protein
MSEALLVPISREEMADLLGLAPDQPIERIDVTFSPIQDEWTLWVMLPVRCQRCGSRTSDVGFKDRLQELTYE